MTINEEANPFQKETECPNGEYPWRGGGHPPDPREDLSTEGNSAAPRRVKKPVWPGQGEACQVASRREGPACSRNLRRATRPPACASCLSRPLLSWPLCHPPASRHSHAPGGKWEASKPFYRCGGQGWELGVSRGRRRWEPQNKPGPRKRVLTLDTLLQTLCTPISQKAETSQTAINRQENVASPHSGV